MSGKKATPRQVPKFQFIISNGPQAVEDPEVRTLIRKQAMRDIGLARRRKRNDRGHTCQAEESDQDEDESDGTAETSNNSSSGSSPDLTESSLSNEVSDGLSETLSFDDEQSIEIRTSSDVSSPITFSFQTGYEKARSRFCLDISSLSVLTNFNVGRAQMPLLSANPERLASLFEFRQWSYLDFIPARYDYSPCIAAATDCVLAKVASVLLPSQKRDQMVCTLYAKALRCIQDAISCTKTSTEPDVLCAIKLLSLHELLDSSREEAWCQHINGSARLIMHRSPVRFTTDFEKALLMTHAGSIVSEAIVSNKHCYLEEPEWTKVLYSMVEDTDELTDTSPLVLNVRVQMLSLPGLWHDLDQLFNSEKLFDDTSYQEMIRRCTEMHDGYMRWLDDYNAHCVRKSFVQVPTEELELRRGMFGTVVECLILVKRFWACLADDKRLQLEVESQALSKLILELNKQAGPKLSWLFGVHEMEMAATTFTTQSAFEEDSQGLSNFEAKLASRQRYNLYNQAMRGKLNL